MTRDVVDDTPRLLVKCQWCGGSVQILDAVPPPDVVQLYRQIEMFRRDCYLSMTPENEAWWSWCCRSWG